jgi:hypothetical protein
MTKDEKDEVDKLLEFLFSPDKEIIELYARILFDKYDYDTIEKHVFNYKPSRIMLQKVGNAYYMYSNVNHSDSEFSTLFNIIYKPNTKSIFVKLESFSTNIWPF